MIIFSKIEDSPSLLPYKKYEAFKEIVDKATTDVLNTNLYHNLFSNHEHCNFVIVVANTRLLFYIHTFPKRFPRLVSFLVSLSKYQKNIKNRLWKIGGKLYTKLAKNTLVGK